MSKALVPAVFLDRDGTIIEDRGHLQVVSDVAFFPDTVLALAKLQEHFLLFVVTHQPGVSLGILSAEEVAQVNGHVVAELSRQGVFISGVFCCPHRREERCLCIKPRPFFLEKAAGDFGLDLRRSFVVGDHPHDVALADNAGAAGIYVLSGHGAKHRAELPACKAVVPGIRAASEWILACRETRQLEDNQPGVLASGASILQNGGIVAFPTETVYGLGATAFNEKAVSRVFAVKGRPDNQQLSSHQERLTSDQ